MAKGPENGGKQPAHELTHALRRADLAYVRLASSEVARDINRDVILELVRAKQPVARVELARASGLYPSTVSAIVEELIEEGWVVEGGTQKLPRGRRPTLLSLNEDIVMLAVDVRPEQATIAVVDMNSRLLSQKAIVLPSNVERALPELIQALERMREMHPAKSFEGIGLSMPGRVDPVTQQLVLAPNLHCAGHLQNDRRRQPTRQRRQTIISGGPSFRVAKGWGIARAARERRCCCFSFCHPRRGSAFACF